MFLREITVSAAVEKLEEVTAFVDGCLRELNCPLRTQMQIEIAVDELFSNIAHYAYPSHPGMATVRVEATEKPASVILTFLDSGIPYNPLSGEEPDITLSVEKRQIGGLGIYMVKKSMDDVSYAYENGNNILRIQKRL